LKSKKFHPKFLGIFTSDRYRTIGNFALDVLYRKQKQVKTVLCTKQKRPV
jgi:hypothetical protein